MNVQIPEQIVNQTGLSTSEFLLKIALLMFQEERLTLGQASKLAGLHQSEFQKELVKHQIPIHYGVDDLERDLKTISTLQ